MRDPKRAAPVLVCAHRMGVGWGLEPGSLRNALAEVAALGVEYVEFDVQRSADGVFFAFHDAHVHVDGAPVEVGTLSAAELAGHLDEVVRYEVVLEAIASVGLKAHLDFKFASPPQAYADAERTAEVAATRLAVGVLGADAIVVTTRREESVAAIRAWADLVVPGLDVGLSVGRGVQGMTLGKAVRTLWGELFPGARVGRSGASVLAANHYLARLTLARLARRHGLKLLVWTVDSPRGLRYWLAPGRAWMVTSNRALDALAARAAHHGPQEA